MAEIKVAVAGAGGRMGRVLVRLACETPGFALAGAFEAKGSPFLGQDAGTLAAGAPAGVTIGDDAEAAIRAADVLMDLTAPAASVVFVQLCAANGKAMVCGTTGFSPAQDVVFAEAAKSIAIVKTGNFSLGVTVLAALVKQAAQALDTDFDIEIVETHHNRKVDAPSGTALLLGEAAATGRGIDLAAVSERGRDGHTGARKRGAIGFASLRGGNVVGEHTVVLAGAAERLELTHRADDRALFGTGAFKAARFAAAAKPGLYAMTDVLGLPRI